MAAVLEVPAFLLFLSGKNSQDRLVLVGAVRRRTSNVLAAGRRPWLLAARRRSSLVLWFVVEQRWRPIRLSWQRWLLTVISVRLRTKIREQEGLARAPEPKKRGQKVS